MPEFRPRRGDSAFIILADVKAALVGKVLLIGEIGCGIWAVMDGTLSSRLWERGDIPRHHFDSSDSAARLRLAQRKALGFV